MDPISAAASIASLLELSIKVTSAIRSYYLAVKNSLKEISEIEIELELLSEALQRLETMITKNGSRSGSRLFMSSSVLATAVKSCEGQIREISSKLELPKDGSISRVLDRLKWPFTAKEVQRLLESLRRYTSTFQFSLTVEGYDLLSKTAEVVSASLMVQSETSRKIFEMTKDISTMSELAKESSRLSDQVSQILALISISPITGDMIESLSIDVKALALESRGEKEARTLDWLSSSLFAQKHHDVRARRIPKTGQWLLNCEKFQTWLTETKSASVLWCVGDPGVGKSTLVSIVVDHLHEIFNTQNVGIAYFYFDYQNQETQIPAHFIACLLRQLAAQGKSFPRPLLELHDRYKREPIGLITTELGNVLKQVRTAFDTCFLVIDALDESDGKQHRREILRVIGDLEHAGFSILVTSRPHSHDINQHLINATQIPIKASEADLRMFCTYMVEANENTSDLLDNTLKEDIFSTISRNAQGMFLLPVLQIQTILDQMTKSEIRRCLRNLSGNLNQVFEDSIKRIIGQNQNRREVAIQTLMWVRYTRRPLHIDELRHALATRVGDFEFDRDNLLPSRSIIESCFGLVVLDDESLTVRLVHYTLQEYLISIEQSLFPRGQALTTNICLTYLCLDSVTEGSGLEIQQIETVLQNFPFLQYAITQWGHHAREATVSEIWDLTSKFLFDESRISFASKVTDLSLPRMPEIQYIAQDPHYESGLHLAVNFGLDSVVALLLDRGVDVNSEDTYRNTPLHIAALRGHLSIAKCLLQRGVRVDKPNSESQTALHLAAFTFHRELIDLLLEHRANPNAPSKYLWTPLHKAADIGDDEAVKLLLKYGASVLAKTSKGLIPLHRAAGRGHINVVRLLLAQGSPIQETTWDGWTPLAGASGNGQFEVVKLLLQHGANVNSYCTYNRTPLHRACRGGHPQTVMHLLQNGADILAKDFRGQIPMHRAAKGGYQEVISILLRQNPLLQLTSIDERGQTARDEAFAAGYWKVARILREEETISVGGQPEKQDELAVAIEEDDVVKIQTLIREGFDIRKVDSDGLTSLHQAFQIGTPDIARILLQGGADIEASTTYGWRPIHSAATRNSEELLSLCLEHKANVMAQTASGQTALHKAAKAGNVKMARMLIERGADIEAPDERGYRPLHAAASAGNENMLRLLLNYDVDFWAVDNDGRSAHDCAAEGGNYDLVEFVREFRIRLGGYMKKKRMEMKE